MLSLVGGPRRRHVLGVGVGAMLGSQAREGGTHRATDNSLPGLRKMKLLESSLSQIEKRIDEGEKLAEQAKQPYDGDRWEKSRGIWGVPGADPKQTLGYATKVWEQFAQDYRDQHPGVPPREEQRDLDALWKEVHPEIYYGSFPDRQTPAPAAPAGASGAEVAKRRKVFPYRGFEAPPVYGYTHFNEGNVPATALGPSDSGVRDWDGREAVEARLPDLGWRAPSKLTETGLEMRGSFMVRVLDASGAPELLVARAGPSGGETPFRCTYRGYRHLQGDFAGKTIYTGYKLVWHSVGGKISSNDIGMSSNPDEFDVMTCRDLETGEVQYFRLRPEQMLANMKERYCAGYKDRSVDISCV